MTNMQALLEQWAKLEPLVCKKSGQTQRFWYVGAWGLVNPDDRDNASYEKILASVVCQLESRRWHYEIRWYGLERVALVYPTGVSQLIRHESSHIVQSLLAAYLAALELSGVKHE